MTQVSPHGLHHVTAIATDPAVQCRLLHPSARAAAGQADGQLRCAGHLSPLLRRREGQPVEPADLLSVAGRAAGSPRCRHDDCDGIQRAGISARLVARTRFRQLGIDADEPRTRDEEEVLTFRDPDGMVIDLVASDGDHRSGWDGVADIPAEHAVRGLHAITLSERQLDPSATMLTELLGMSLTGEEGERSRFGMAGGSSGALVDVFAGVRDRGWQAGGTVHHVAFRAPDLATQTLWQQELRARGVSVTDIIDRQYFKSIYFREPGGVLFEIATDAPGFAVDEPLLELGRSLKLPPWLEPDRAQIAAALPPLQLEEDIP